MLPDGNLRVSVSRGPAVARPGDPKDAGLASPFLQPGSWTLGHAPWPAVWELLSSGRCGAGETSRGRGLTTGLRPPSPTGRAGSSSSALRCGPACCLDQNLVRVSRHLRFGRDTIKVHRDALWDLRQKESKGRGSPLCLQREVASS